MADGFVGVTPSGRSKPRPYEENSGWARLGVDVAGVFVGVTPGGRSKRRPYEENSGWARFGVDGLDFEGRIQIWPLARRAPLTRKNSDD